MEREMRKFDFQIVIRFEFLDTPGDEVAPGSDEIGKDFENERVRHGGPPFVKSSKRSRRSNGSSRSKGFRVQRSKFRKRLVVDCRVVIARKSKGFLGVEKAGENRAQVDTTGSGQIVSSRMIFALTRLWSIAKKQFRIHNVFSENWADRASLRCGRGG